MSLPVAILLAMLRVLSDLCRRNLDVRMCPIPTTALEKDCTLIRHCSSPWQQILIVTSWGASGGFSTFLGLVAAPSSLSFIAFKGRSRVVDNQWTSGGIFIFAFGVPITSSSSRQVSV